MESDNWDKLCKIEKLRLQLLSYCNLANRLTLISLKHRKVGQTCKTLSHCFKIVWRVRKEPDYRLFTSRRQTDSFVFFSLRLICSKYADCSNQRDFFRREQKSLRFTHFTNMSNQISPKRVIAKKSLQEEQFFSSMHLMKNSRTWHLNANS